MSQTRSILEHLLKMGRATNPQLAAVVGQISAGHANTLCRHLARRGWVELHADSRPRLRVWTPTAKLRTEGIDAALMRNVRDRVWELIESGVREIPALATAAQTTHPTVCSIVKRLEEAGSVRRIKTGARTYVVPVDDEDDGWTPKPYINPIRARALGVAA